MNRPEDNFVLGLAMAKNSRRSAGNGRGQRQLACALGTLLRQQSREALGWGAIEGLEQILAIDAEIIKAMNVVLEKRRGGDAAELG